MPETAPFILTLLLDEASAAFFNDLRKRYFPPAINYLQAHLTLFHHLPATEPSLREDLRRWSREHPPMLLNITAVKSIGKGVAYHVECPSLQKLHRHMQETWKGWLRPQDQQKLWPHITVQNKVSPAAAQETLQALQASFQPFTATGTGFGLWYYRGGPWEWIEACHFQKR